MTQEELIEAVKSMTHRVEADLLGAFPGAQVTVWSETTGAGTSVTVRAALRQDGRPAYACWELAAPAAWPGIGSVAPRLRELLGVADG